MQKIVLLKKEVGETPLQALEKYRKEEEESLKDAPMTYAGRLDPMAEGLLVILIGDECKDREKYTKLNKEYEFEVLLGATTDTGDILGLIEKIDITENIEETNILKIIPELLGKHNFPYPKFSSKTIQGKPLFQHALAGEIDSIIIPPTKTEIFSLKYLGNRRVNRETVVSDILKKIERFNPEVNEGEIGSDFRKDQIIKNWVDKKQDLQEKVVLLKFSALVASGTYIRTLSEVIAQKLGTVGLAYSINRTKIIGIESL